MISDWGGYSIMVSRTDGVYMSLRPFPHMYVRHSFVKII